MRGFKCSILYFINMFICLCSDQLRPQKCCNLHKRNDIGTLLDAIIKSDLYVKFSNDFFITVFETFHVAI